MNRFATRAISPSNFSRQPTGAATFDAVLTGFLICAHRWNFTDIATEGDASQAWRHRVDVLIPPDGNETDTFSASRLFAATYPEAVALANMIGSLHWRRLATGDPDQLQRFADEIGRQLALRDYYPTLTKDPIAHWMEADCWQPPSLPNTTYHNLKTFGGRSIRKPPADIDNKRRIAASWFVRKHRRGGDTMLHHRTLNPVIIRDWSTKMEIFAGALDLTANTTIRQKPRTAKDFTNLATTKWIRPQPAASPYLDSATEPVNWPTRTGPRPPTGARPSLPHEQR